MPERGDPPTSGPLVPSPRDTSLLQAWQSGSSPLEVNAPAAPAVNVNVSTPMVVTTPRGLPFIVRALWYLFIGRWLTALVIVIGYLFLVTIIGIPVAFALFNRIPQLLTLRTRTVRYRTDVRDGITYLTAGTEAQRPWYQRAVYFLLVGWWFGAVWLVAAWLIGLLIV